MDSTNGSKGKVVSFKTGGLIRYKMIEGRHSGEAMTSLGNSANNIWITSTIYDELDISKWLHTALILGDDNLSIFHIPLGSKLPKVDTISRKFADYGF